MRAQTPETCVPTTLNCEVSLETSLEVWPPSRLGAKGSRPQTPPPGRSCLAQQPASQLRCVISGALRWEPGRGWPSWHCFSSFIPPSHTALGLLAQISVWRSPGV